MWQTRSTGSSSRQCEKQEESTNTRTNAHSITGKNAMLLTPSPVLPPLPPEEYAALRDHIARNGVEQPILVTASGVIIDGHERYRTVTELRLRKYPIRVVGNLTEQERRARAIALNLFRRHMSRAERQHWLEELIRLNPQISSRDLAAKQRLVNRRLQGRRRRSWVLSQVTQLRFTVAMGRPITTGPSQR